MSYIQNPSSIEEKSFQIIQSMIDREHPDYRFHSPMEESIIKRAIHTSGDFDYLYTMRFTHGVNDKIIQVFEQKGTIFLDSAISLNGINKRVLDQMGVCYKYLFANEEALQAANDRQMNRDMVAVEYAARIPGPKIFAFGDNPTALVHLLELAEKENLDVAAVIGLPVGFINVEESKEALLTSQLPAIATIGRKGGSTVVVSTINAILYQMKAVLTDDYIRYSTPNTSRKGE